MVYSLCDRFSPPPKYFAFYDPGTYQYEKRKIKPNTVPFLSNVLRKTGPGNKLWTEATYDAALSHSIPNITAFRSKKSRFPYEALSAEDLEEILCKCGVEHPCVCPIPEDETSEEIVCQGKVRRRIFKGHGPRSVLGDGGLSTPSRRDHGFEIQADGKQNRIKEEIKNKSPPFYDARVIESTGFYHGCKWSQRTSRRTQTSLEVRPGPAHYYLDRVPTKEEICADKVRAYKRKRSKQLRFIEMVQQQNIKEGRPGPSAYSPQLPKGTDLQYLGPKAERFFSKYEVYPGPADHWVRRDFDPVEPPEVLCLATLPEPSFFGVKAQRFKPLREQGPSPATYDTNYKPCQFVHCPTTPFLSSAVRFKPDVIEESDEEETTEKEENVPKNCPIPMWQFKSKTIRMKPLIKMMYEPSPADLPQSKHKIKRSSQYQYAAPFYSSEGRFQPWYNWLPVHGKYETPGPCYYDLELPRGYSAFNHGPMFRAKRFPEHQFETPAPNKYQVWGGIETILKTHNHRLTENIKNQHQFIWEPPLEPDALSYEQRESLILQKCIALLEPDELKGPIDKLSRRSTKSTIAKTSISDKISSRESDKLTQDLTDSDPNKPRMLRSFLWSHQVPFYF